MLVKRYNHVPAGDLHGFVSSGLPEGVGFDTGDQRRADTPVSQLSTPSRSVSSALVEALRTSAEQSRAQDNAFQREVDAEERRAAAAERQAAAVEKQTDATAAKTEIEIANLRDDQRAKKIQLLFQVSSKIREETDEELLSFLHGEKRALLQQLGRKADD